MTASAQPPPSARGPFGSADLTAMVVANMIGAGLFTTSGFTLASLGSAERVMAAWAVAGLIALAGAVVYGALVRRFPGSGGEYLFLSRGLHPAAGAIAGWTSLIAGFSGAIALAALAAEAYLPFPPGLPEGAVALVLVLAAGVIHGARTLLGIRLQTLLVAAKVLLMAALIGWGLWTVGDWPARPAAPVPPLAPAAFATALVWISLSYSGFNAAAYVAGESEEAARRVPRAMLLGTVLTILLYLGLNAVMMFGAPDEAVRGRPDVAMAAAHAIGGDWLAGLVRITILVALVTSLSAMIVAGPRVYARMAEDGALPGWLRAGPRGPRRAIALQTGIAAAFVLGSGLLGLISYLGLTLMLCSALAATTLLVRREGLAPVPAAARLVALFYIAATLVLAAVGAREQPQQLAGAVATILVGLVAAFAGRRLRS